MIVPKEALGKKNAIEYIFRLQWSAQREGFDL